MPTEVNDVRRSLFRRALALTSDHRVSQMSEDRVAFQLVCALCHLEEQLLEFGSLVYLDTCSSQQVSETFKVQVGPCVKLCKIHLVGLELELDVSQKLRRVRSDLEMAEEMIPLEHAVSLRAFDELCDSVVVLAVVDSRSGQNSVHVFSNQPAIVSQSPCDLLDRSEFKFEFVFEMVSQRQQIDVESRCLFRQVAIVGFVIKLDAVLSLCLVCDFVAQQECYHLQIVKLGLTVIREAVRQQVSLLVVYRHAALRYHLTDVVFGDHALPHDVRIDQ